MFGLLRSRKSRRCAGWNQWRLNYCGTCKSIGSTYGHPARMLLNHDTVFLAELMHHFAPPDTASWNPALRSFNCMSLPAQSPEALRFAAAATVVFAEYKLRDQVEDAKAHVWLWRRIARWWNPRFRRAVSELRHFGFDVEALDIVLSRQHEVERNGATVEHFARPTATAASMFFERGAYIAARPDLAAAFADFGHHFGFLIYVLDAVEDQKKDLASRSFNALTQLGWTREQGIASVDEARRQCIAALQPLDSKYAAAFASRIGLNLDERFGRSLTVQNGRRHAPTPRLTWTKAWDRAEELAEGRAWLVVAAVALTVFALPDHTRDANSAEECFSLGTNLMAIGSVFAMARGKGTRSPAGGGAKSAAATGCCAGDACGGCECCAEGCCDCACDECACASCGECGSCCHC